MITIVCKTGKALVWARENLETEDDQWISSNTVVVEDRFIEDIAIGIFKSDLKVGTDISVKGLLDMPPEGKTSFGKEGNL